MTKIAAHLCVILRKRHSMYSEFCCPFKILYQKNHVCYSNTLILLQIIHNDNEFNKLTAIFMISFKNNYNSCRLFQMRTFFEPFIIEILEMRFAGRAAKFLKAPLLELGQVEELYEH